MLQRNHVLKIQFWTTS